MKSITLSILLVFVFSIMTFETAMSQGQNSTWLLGHHYSTSSFEGRMNFDTSSYNITSEQRVIPFLDTEGNISDANGNLLMSSNGYFIADATGDTMMNGSGINPNQCTLDYGVSDGMFLPYGNIFLPMPGDTTKYILFHQTCDYNSATLNSIEIFYSVIDITLNNGMGAVISKNNIVLTGNFAYGMTACKHGNGRDWWLTALSDSGTTVYKILITPNSITYIGSQAFSVQPNPGQAGQPVFSPNGAKFTFRNAYNNGVSWLNNLRLFDFDRCSGQFTLDTAINYSDGSMAYGWGTMFSPNSQYLYFSTSQTLYQIDVTASNISSTQQIVAINDTFLSAPPVFYTNFYLMYLANNGKIYITSTSGVLHLHEMNYPDSLGTACDVELHNILLPCFNVGTVPNHPNYYLGALTGSVCDSLTSTPEIVHDFRFSISPNPSDGNFQILYLLPQNKKGRLNIHDINGKSIYEINLPPWSTMQNISLPSTIADGIYNCVINSGIARVNKKLVVIRN